MTSAKIRNGHVRQPDLGDQVIAARAYALVRWNGTVNESRSHNITDAHVSRPQPGAYCIGVCRSLHATSW